MEQVYGAIAFYLANRAEIDAYLERGRKEFEHHFQAARDSAPGLYQKIDRAREHQTT